MKNLKKILVFTLILALSISLFSVASATSDNQSKNNAKNTIEVLSADVQFLKDLGLLKGDGSGLTYDYTHAKITRMQGFIIYLRLINAEINFDQFTYRHGHDDNFDDQDNYSSYVQKLMGFAKANGVYNWTGENGKFNPMANLTAKQYAKIMLTALQYEYGAGKDFEWNTVEQFAQAHGLNVPEGNFTVEALATMTRQTLYLEMKDTGKTLIEYLALIIPDFGKNVAPIIVKRETQDLNNNGSLDAIKLTFSKNINDNTFTALDFTVEGRINPTFNPTTNQDNANNNVIYISFTETGLPDTDATPSISYTQNTLADLFGNEMLSTVAAKTTDKAAPAVMNKLASPLTAGAQLVLSEEITAANQAEVLSALKAKTTIIDTSKDDISAIYVWSSGKLLTVGDIEANNVTLAATTSNLVDSKGNIALATLMTQ